MITVTITERGQFIDEIEFDADNVVARTGSPSVVHRHVMQDCRFDGIWYRVAHAAGIVGRRGYLPGMHQTDERRQADIDAALSLPDELPDLPPDPTAKIEQQPAASKAVVDDDSIASSATRTRPTRTTGRAAGRSVATGRLHPAAAAATN